MRDLTSTSVQEVARAIASSRREFLRLATGALAAPTLFGMEGGAAHLPARAQKAIVVTFGGGARDDETFEPDGQENIPKLLRVLMPQATLFGQVINRGILGHYVATASLTTGVYESFNNFAAVPPENPTIFEYFRRDRKRPSTDAWVIAPSNGFNRIGESGNRSYGAGLGATVVLPKRLLAAALPRGRAADLRFLLRDNYESAGLETVSGGTGIDLERLAGLLRFSVEDFLAHAQSVRSPDELSVFVARHLMRQLAPSLIWITLHDIDVAHSGAFSLYVDAIRRTDRLCGELWQAVQQEPEYAGKTRFFILPDFGRDADESPGGNGFQHHRTGDAVSRTTWLMALGPGVRENVVIERAVESVDLVPTIGSLLGFDARYARGKPLAEVT